MKRAHGTVYAQTAINGIAVNRSQLTPITKTTGRLAFVCPICGVGFTKPAAWAKRCNNHYCGRACASEAKKVRIETHCAVCGKSMEQTPSNAVRIVTCSKRCSSLRRRGDSTRPVSFGVYKAETHRIASRGVCKVCGVRHGPWCVRGLKVGLDATDMPVIDSTNAELWCRHCHLSDLAPTGGEANKQRLTTKGEINGETTYVQ